MTGSSLWWRNGIIYQIYPRSFADSNADGLGDLPGITSRLDYLGDLGIDAIWLSPIYPSPDADFGYDISDYCAVDPRFGTMADFDHLVSESHRRGIRVVLDLVINHTSDQHPWFVESRSSRSSSKRDWYLWADRRSGGRRPNNWRSIFGGSGWEWDEATGQYYFHMFTPRQPDLNFHHPPVRAAVLDVVRFWLDRGVDGFRMDVFNAYFKDPHLPNNPPALGLRGFDRQRHQYDVNQPGLIPFLQQLRSLVDSYPDRYLIGETFLEGAARAASYCCDDLLHAAFNFDFTRSGWQPASLLKQIQRWEILLGKERWPNYVFNNHDLSRSATRFHTADDDAQLKAAAALLLSLRGTPFLYYGEEIGMRDVALERQEVLDPPGQRYWPFYKGRDGFRSPMQWDATPQAGFSCEVPWLRVHPDYRVRNVAAQQADPSSLLNFYRRMIALRRVTPALQHGDFQPLTLHPRDALVYMRRSENQTALVAINFTARQINVSLPDLPPEKAWECCLTSHPAQPAVLNGTQIKLAPYEAAIFLSL